MTDPPPVPDATTSPPPPLLDCDIVMKGGITSGVVYPKAVVRIARTYRIHAIGGTSVGAIVARLDWVAASVGGGPRKAKWDDWTRAGVVVGESGPNGRRPGGSTSRWSRRLCRYARSLRRRDVSAPLDMTFGVLAMPRGRST